MPDRRQTDLRFTFTTAPEYKDALLGLLSNFPFSAFEELDEGWSTGLAADAWNDQLECQLEELQARFPVLVGREHARSQNWNALWEASFAEVRVDGFCQIRAPFHPRRNDMPYEVIIRPQMAFGTGHHESTRLMIRLMKGLDLREKRVLDFGAGTGVLAILTEKMGAAEVVAIEKDGAAVENLQENLTLNNAQKVHGIKG